MKEISTVFSDAIVPEPGPKTSTYAGMGKPISDAPAAAQGQMSEVQYCDLGNTTPTKIPGGGSY